MADQIVEECGLVRCWCSRSRDEMVRVRREEAMNIMNAPPATSPAIARDGFERMRLNINGTDIVVLSIGTGPCSCSCTAPALSPVSKSHDNGPRIITC